MKKILLATAALLMIASISTSCGRGKLKGFNRTKTGLNYKFHVKGDGERAKLGDIIIAEIWVYMGDNLDYTNEGMPEPMFQVMESQHGGDLMEALQMVGKGDSVTFAFNLDTLRKYNPGMPEDSDVKYLYYTIKVHGAYSMEEFETKMEEDRIRGEAEEMVKLEAYISEKGITAKPNDDGVYVIVTTRGTGAVAAKEKNVSVNYVGKLLDGTLFDTSLEEVAKEHDLYNPQRSYSPFEFPVGVGYVIPGWDAAVEGMRVGTKATLIVPSNMAYGSSNRPGLPAFSTLVFDIEIVSVQ